MRERRLTWWCRRESSTLKIPRRPYAPHDIGVYLIEVALEFNFEEVALLRGDIELKLEFSAF